MSEDLHLGGMSKRTHEGYLRAVRQLADFCQCASDQITEDQFRKFFLHLKNDKSFASGSLRVAFSGIRFFYTRTCRRDLKLIAITDRHGQVVMGQLLADHATSYLDSGLTR